MKKYRILHLPILSFFSKRLYRDVGRNWKGTNLTYLFLLLAICLVAPTISLQDELVNELENKPMRLINQLPDIRIKDGAVRVEQEEPYLIRKDGKTVAIIDTTGSMNYIDDDHVQALLTENELILRRGRNQFNTIDLSQVPDFHLNQQIASRWIELSKKSILPLSYGLFLLLSYTFILTASILISIIGKLISGILRSSLTFAGIMRISSVAATPSIILIALSSALELHIPAPFFASLSILYLLIGIAACAKKSEGESPQIQLTSLLADTVSEQRSTRAA